MTRRTLRNLQAQAVLLLVVVMFLVITMVVARFRLGGWTDDVTAAGYLAAILCAVAVTVLCLTERALKRLDRKDHP